MNDNENYFANKDITQKELIVKYINIANSFLPEATAAMPYGVPGLKLGTKNLIAFAAFKKHLGVYPMSPKIVTNVAKDHKVGDFSKGTLRFSFDNLPSIELIKDILKQRAAEINE